MLQILGNCVQFFFFFQNGTQSKQIHDKQALRLFRIVPLLFYYFFFMDLLINLSNFCLSLLNSWMSFKKTSKKLENMKIQELETMKDVRKENYKYIVILFCNFQQDRLKHTFSALFSVIKISGDSTKWCCLAISKLTGKNAFNNVV